MIALKSVRVCNFKAIKDSKTVKLGAFTVFIGNNGSGKSCLLDAMEAYSEIVAYGVDGAFQRHGGFEYAVNKAVLSDEEKEKMMPEEKTKKSNVKAMYRNMLEAGFPGFHYPMQFHFRAKGKAKPLWNLAVSLNAEQNKVAIVGEEIVHYDHDGYWCRGFRSGISMYNRYTPQQYAFTRLSMARTMISACHEASNAKHPSMGTDLFNFVDGWVFLALYPEQMGNKRIQERGSRRIKLKRNGENIAQYLLDMRKRDQNAFDGVLEALQYVLPYIKDIQPCITHELERCVYLQAREQEYELPGWLLSTGSLRILALLALLRSPHPPTLIAIDEIENGIDARTIHLLLEEIRAATRSGRTQVIATTHSPYLLDQLGLEDIVLVERINGGEPQFWRPASDEHVQSWAKNFAPGQLYTMDRFRYRRNK